MEEQTGREQSFISDLQALWSAEKMLTEAMPGMIDRATNLGLKKNLAHHLAETDQQRVAIEAMCKQLGYPHEGAANTDLQRLLSEGESAMAAAGGGEAMDAAIITGAITVEHYEIEQYTRVSAAAAALGYDGIAKRLRLSLEEERQADAKLNYLDKAFVQQSSVLGNTRLALR